MIVKNVKCDECKEIAPRAVVLISATIAVVSADEVVERGVTIEAADSTARLAVGGQYCSIGCASRVFAATLEHGWNRAAGEGGARC